MSGRAPRGRARGPSRTSRRRGRRRRRAWMRRAAEGGAAVTRPRVRMPIRSLAEASSRPHREGRLRCLLVIYVASRRRSRLDLLSGWTGGHWTREDSPSLMSFTCALPSFSHYYHEPTTTALVYVAYRLEGAAGPFCLVVSSAAARRPCNSRHLYDTLEMLATARLSAAMRR